VADVASAKKPEKVKKKNSPEKDFLEGTQNCLLFEIN